MQTIVKRSTNDTRRGIAVPRAVRALAAIVSFAAVATSCGGSHDARTVGVYTLAIGDSTQPALQAAGGGGGGGGGAIYEVQVPVTLPLIKKPALTGAAVDPYGAPIWYGPRDVQVQVSFVLTNLSDEYIIVQVLVDGWNEFIRYTPMVSVDAEGNINEDLSTNGRRILLPARGRVTGVFSYDDMERIAMDLAAIMNKAPNPFHVVEPHTRLLEDPTTAPYVPSQIDGLTGFDLSLRTSSKVKIALEATVEIIDNGGFIVPEGSGSDAQLTYPSTLTTYRPVIAKTGP